MTNQLYALLLLFYFFSQNSYGEDIDAIKSVPLTVKATSAVDGLNESGEAVYLELGVLPGALYGRPSFEPRWLLDVVSKKGASIDLLEFEKKVMEYVKPMIDHGMNDGLVINPPSANFLRVSTFGYLAQDSSRISGGFEDAAGNPVFLAYFDRKCTLVGRQDFGEDGIYNHDIVVDRPGLYKIIVSLVGDEYQVTAKRDTQALVVVLK